ncbi:MAG: hypothetical protein K5651_00435 [Bacteroidales bacterium]|nr:hypothetical protein [Bacteroidales bacterium]
MKTNITMDVQKPSDFARIAYAKPVCRLLPLRIGGLLCVSVNAGAQTEMMEEFTIDLN